MLFLGALKLLDCHFVGVYLDGHALRFFSVSGALYITLG
jgi:hypothetical protein